MATIGIFNQSITNSNDIPAISVIAAEDLRPPADVVEDSLAETADSQLSVP